MNNRKPVIFRITTVPISLNVLLRNQLAFLNRYFTIYAVSSPGLELSAVKEREKVLVRPLKMKREISVLHDILSLFRLFFMILKVKPDIIHSNTPKASLLSMVAGFFARIPIRVYTVTGLRFETEAGLKRKILILMEKITCRFATHVVAESTGVRAKLIENRITSRPAEILWNGNINCVDLDFWNPALITEEDSNLLEQELNLKEEDFRVVYVGRIVRDKGIRELYEAFVSIYSNDNRVKLILVGQFENTDNSLGADLINKINSHPGIICVGFQEDIRRYLKISDVLILPSYREGFPNVILQANAMGLPVICTDVNGADDLIDGRNGIIIQKKNVDQIVAAIKSFADKAIHIDPEYCRKVVANRFDQKKYYQHLLSFYNRILNKK